jgi:two-component system sensor histidine kinase/response regulator
MNKGGSGKVLIVDDEPLNLSVLGATLRAAGYDVRVAASGAEGYEAIQYSPPDVVLLDVMMPHIDGFELLRRLRLDPRSARIPVIFLTALSDPELKARALRAGCVDFVTKPFAAADVLRCIASHVGKAAMNQAVPTSGLK